MTGKNVWVGRFLLSAVMAFGLAVSGCSSTNGADGADGEDGAPGAPGEDGMDGMDGQDGSDGSEGGPGPGSVIDMSDPDGQALIYAIGQPLVVVITGVTVSSPPEITYEVFTQNGASVSGVGTVGGSDRTQGSVRGMFDKLIGTSGAIRSHWVSYINSTSLPPLHATRETGTVVEDPMEPGSYTFTYTTDVTNVTTPVVVAWEPALTHRASMEIRFSDSGLNPDNPSWDFVPNGGDLPETKDIANTDLCNNCHQRLEAHGNGRFTVENCVTCHNSSTGADDVPEIGPVDGALTNVDMAHLAHGIHSTRLDMFDEVTYPRFIVDCAACHTASEETPDGDDWKESVDSLSCGGCHMSRLEVLSVDEGTGLAAYGFRHDFETIPDGDCLQCHNGGIAAAGFTEENHQNLTDPETAKFQYNILSVTNTDEGEQPQITFSVTDPTNGDAEYDIYAEGSPWDSSGARLAVTVAWTTEAYYNLDSGSSEAFFRASAAQPVSVEVAGANAPTQPDGVVVVDKGDQTYTVTSPVAVPEGLMGDSLAVTIEGHPWVDLNEDGEVNHDDVPPWRDEEIPVTGAVASCEIRDRAGAGTGGAGGAPAPEDCIDEDGEGDGTPRYQVVDINLCNNCHNKLALHGQNRTDNINACVTCHNGDATDIAARNQGSDGTCLGGSLDEEACTLDVDCGPSTCTGGDDNGAACTNDDDCTGTGATEDGTCDRTADPSDGTCEPNGRSLCDAGSNDGDACLDDTDCPDGGTCELVETAIDFKRMVHQIHAADTVIFGFGGSVHDYTEVTFPRGSGNNLAKCTVCHLEGTYYPTRDDVDFRWATTTDTGADLGDPEDDVNTTTNTSACGACHTSAFAESHMQDEGGSFDAQQDVDGELTTGPGRTRIETCTNCHAPGQDGDVARAHDL